MNHGQWTKGKPIPAKYRNRLYAWEGGGYDGCLWEMNHGVVTDDGHWDPFNSTGRDGLDLDDWHAERIRELKRDLGFRADRYGTGEDVESWYSGIRYKALEEARKKVYGEKYNDNPEFYDPDAKNGSFFPDARRSEVEAYVNEHTAKETAVYTEYKERRKKLDAEWHERLDEIFMDQVKAQAERPANLHPWDYKGTARDRWEEYPLDEYHVKESCRRFCEQYSKTVGVMAGVLDALNDRGYETWCTCSDCGEQFQLSDYEKYEHLIDDGCYHGDGGIGCIFTRVQCEKCRRETECPNCYEPNLPSEKDVREGHAYDRYTFRERFIAQWIGVCDSCAYGFFRKENAHWCDDVDELETTIDRGMAQIDEYMGLMRRKGLSEEELGSLYAKNLVEMKSEWKDLVNGLRDRMEDDVKEHYSDCDFRASDRLGDADPYEF